MNLQEFIKKYENKLVDEKGNISTTFVAKNPKEDYNGDYQCVDLIKAYVRDMFGIEGRYGNARHYASGIARANPKVFDFISKGGGRVVQPGDIVSIHTSNKYGHIGIVTKITGNGFEIIDQNGADGAHGYGRYDDRIQRRSYGYTNIIGWARPKNNPLWRRNVAKRIFDALKKPRFIGHSAAEIWNLLNPMQITTRSEVAGMIKNYFSRIEKRNIDESRIWNKTRPNDPVSKSELDTMIGRAKSL
ncbi:hypothetical protein BLM37_04640 [Candidatus Gracilibacteria bacterium GN02-873]|nr:hypothetical protein BLM37_04640 [Candidatus Gracilibacteria bacterium GN02-873]